MREQLSIQEFIHQLERGKYAIYIKSVLYTVLIGGLTMLYLFIQFAGLDSVAAMDQAQISKNIASGKGFSTDYIRPLAVWQLRENYKAGEIVDVTKFPDFFQSPLSPAVNAVPLWFAKSLWKSDPSSLVYKPDLILASVSLVFFLLAVAGWYFVAARLFDKGLAFLVTVLVLVTDMMWKFSLSALPQMLMLFIFSLVILASLSAAKRLEDKNPLFRCIFLAVAGLLLGLLTLTHGLGVWFFAGWLIWVISFFRPRLISAAIGVVCFFIVVSPWLVRNYVVCGDPFGLGMRAAQVNVPLESDLFRAVNPDFLLTASVSSKLRTGIVSQVGNIVGFLGTNFVALAFFAALMHPFKNPHTAAIKWAVTFMWVGALTGMAIFGVEGPISVNQMHILFLPIFVAYGFAFLMVLWNRLHIEEVILRRFFIGVIIFLVAIPQMATVLGGPQKRVQWPPYIPPFIGIFNTWFGENEIICSDMPWAVAWYAGRKSLLLPSTRKEFNDLHDYKQLTLPINGLYLTPLTRDQPLFSQIYSGRYKEWAGLITVPPQVSGFPLGAFTPLPIDEGSIIFADRDRWNVRR